VRRPLEQIIAKMPGALARSDWRRAAGLLGPHPLSPAVQVAAAAADRERQGEDSPLLELLTEDDAVKAFFEADDAAARAAHARAYGLPEPAPEPEQPVAGDEPLEQLARDEVAIATEVVQVEGDAGGEPDDADVLLAHLRKLGPTGIAKSELHKYPPAGLGRAAAGRAMEQLVRRGLVAVQVEERGANRAPTTVYRATAAKGAEGCQDGFVAR
jgi:hypothetical protein